MRIISLLAVAVFVAGCSSHSVVPQQSITPQIFQRQPHVGGGWITTVLKSVGGHTAKPNGIVADLARVWTSDAAGAISEVDMNQHVKTFTLSIKPNSITIGSDSNLWLTTPTGTIAKVTIAGAETDYVVAPGMHLANITSGPDGGLWFNECSSDKKTGAIGTITISGTYTSWNVGCQDVIEGGPDGNIWYGNGAALASMTTQGSPIGQYTLGYTSLIGIANGSDGDVYVTGSAATGPSTLTRITTLGQVTLLGTDSSGDGVKDITSGPDGALWMSGHGAKSSVLVTYDPTTQLFMGPIHAAAEGQIITGPDANMWLPDQVSAVHTYTRLQIGTTPMSLAINSGQGAPFTVNESNYNGQWTAKSSNPSVATVGSDQNGTFAVTAISPGVCEIDVRDTMLNSTKVKVTVR